MLAIGFFDGLHRGHREILRTLLRSRRPGYRAAVLTFRNHPSTFLRPDRVPPFLSTLEERVNLLASSGIDELFLVPFDAHIARLEAKGFCVDIIAGVLRASGLTIGENFRFGAQRSGDATLARETLEPLGVKVTAAPPLLDAEDRISSTRIRAAVLRGDMATANRLLGASYVVRGRIALGEGRGHDLGFPTANLVVPPEKTLPADGVYAAVARTVEAWLLDFQGTAYGEELALRDFQFIREQRKFAAVEDLLAQMHDDATHVRFPSFLPT